MCFTNLPVEFDEEGNPYLADEADEVARPGTHDRDHDHGVDCDCGTEAVPLEEDDPVAAYEEIVAAMPATARKRLGSATDADERQPAPDAPERERAGGD